MSPVRTFELYLNLGKFEFRENHRYFNTGSPSSLKSLERRALPLLDLFLAERLSTDILVFSFWVEQGISCDKPH